MLRICLTDVEPTVLLGLLMDSRMLMDIKVYYFVSALVIFDTPVII